MEFAGHYTERRLSNVEEATRSIVRSKAVASLVRYVVQVLCWVSYIIVFYYYLSFVLLAFAETRGLAELLLKYVTEPILDILNGIVGFLPNLITLGIIAIVAHYAVKGLRVFFDNVEAGSFELGEFEPHWIGPTFHILRVVIYLIALVFAYP